MDSFRCAVVSGEDVPGARAAIVAALGHCKELEVVGGDTFSAAPVNGIVFVTGMAQFERTLHRVAEVRSLNPSTAILVAIAGAEADAMDALLGAGAYDFVSVPFTPNELVARLRRALGIWPAPRHLPLERSAEHRVRGFVYACASTHQLAAKLPAIAGCNANVLILGETGTGKEVCAQAIHYLSQRASNPWIAVNCGAIPVELVENELFGHVKGAYTTAHSARAGLVREAEGGTLFLDDVDCLPLAAQAKLLRFLQEREYRPVGSNTVMHADVRVIAASNCNVQALARQGSFRQDLYFRLNVLRLNLPALRERRDDIPVLALHFVKQFAREFERPVTALTPSAVRKLFAHDWPGNVRELRHVIERAILLCNGPALVSSDIEIESDAPDAPAERADDESFRSAKSRVVREFERGYLERVLTACSGNVTQAAMVAQKDRRAFFELIRKHEIEPRRFRSA